MKNPQFHNWTQHIDFRDYFTCEAIETSLVILQYVQSKDNTVDMFTKALSGPVHKQHMIGLGLRVVC